MSFIQLSLSYNYTFAVLWLTVAAACGSAAFQPELKGLHGDGRKKSAQIYVALSWVAWIFCLGMVGAGIGAVFMKNQEEGAKSKSNKK